MKERKFWENLVAPRLASPWISRVQLTPIEGLSSLKLRHRVQRTGNHAQDQGSANKRERGGRVPLRGLRQVLTVCWGNLPSLRDLRVRPESTWWKAWGACAPTCSVGDYCSCQENSKAFCLAFVFTDLYYHLTFILKHVHYTHPSPRRWWATRRRAWAKILEVRKNKENEEVEINEIKKNSKQFLVWKTYFHN